MVVLSSLHVHHETIDAHDDCQQCVGHIEKAHHHDHDCLFCDFLAQSYLAQDKEQQAILFSSVECVSMPTPTMVPLFHRGETHLRAPPMA